MALINEKNKSLKTKKTEYQTGILNEKNMMKKSEMKEKRMKVISSFAEIFPIIDIAEHDYFELRNGEYMEIVQITSKDIYSLNESDKDNDIFSLAYLYQAYIPDLKIVPLHTPVNLELQKNKIIKNIRSCKKPQYLSFLEKKLSELEFIEEHRTNKDFFFFLYGENPKILSERKSQIRKLLIQSNQMIELDLEKKINVLFQLSNLNTKPKVD